MMKYLFLLSVLTIGLFSCTKENDNPNFHFEYLPVNEIIIPDSLDYKKEYNLTLKYTLPNDCYYYNNIYYTAKDTTRTVAIVAFVDDDASCVEDAKQEEKTLKLTVFQKEDYIFKIYKGTNNDDENIYKEIITRVIEDGVVQ